MTKYSLPDNWKQLDQRVRREDEDRWLSSRYAAAAERNRLIALYALNLELAKVRLVVSEPGLAAIRFQWWRDVTAEMAAGKRARGHDVVAAIYDAELSPKLVEGLVDGHDAALADGDRGLEPESLLMRASVGILTRAHGWGTHIDELASAFATARRGASEEYGSVLPVAPAVIRPALAHGALRFDYAGGKSPGPLRKRFVIMRAMLTGIV